MQRILDQLNIINKRSYDINKLIPTKKLTIPCIELYEFELKGYMDDPNTQHRFGTLTNSPKNTCGSIQVTEKKYDLMRTSSCDSLSSDIVSQKGGIFAWYDFYDMYKKFKARDPTIQTNYYTKTQQDDVIILLHKVINLNKDYIAFNSSIPLKDIKHDDALIYKVNVNNNEKVVIFGDFHGSFHTFLRHIFRLRRIGIISSLTNWKMADGYRLIFLGDVLDRGNYSLEILIIICYLIINNNTNNQLKVIYNRGNHEEKQTYNGYGFKNEFANKLKDIDKDFQEQTLNDFYSTFSSAIILENEDNMRFWLSHGGIPLNYPNSDEIIKLEDNKIIHIKATINPLNIPFQIRWNDFVFNCNDRTNIRPSLNICPKHIKNFFITNNISFIIRGHQDYPYNSFLLSNIQKTHSTGMKYAYVPGERINLPHIDPRKLKEKPKPNQSRYSSDLKFKEYKEGDAIPDGWELDGKLPEHMQNPDKDNDTVFLNKNYINYDSTKTPERIAVHGPIARVALNGLEWNADKDLGGMTISDTATIYPVITLSTNNDMDRPMKYDSFGILRFDLSKDKLNKFDKETNLHDIRKIDYEINFSYVDKV